MIVVLDGYTTNPGDVDWKPLERIDQVKVYDWTEADEIAERASKASAVIVNKVTLDAAAFDKLPSLKYVGVLATGYDSVDIEAAKKRGIVVTNVPAYASQSVAQQTFALILELCAKCGAHSEDVIQRQGWSRQPFTSYWLQPIIGLEDKTLGIVGMGRIGENVARIGEAFGMRIVAYDAYPREMEGVEWLSLEELLQTSDFVSLHCPLFPQTRGIINEKALSLMKSSAFLINTSRGPLVEEEDLASALTNGTIAGAGLDVLSTEPPSADNPLLSANNVIITPHLGWATRENRYKLIQQAAHNYDSYLRGEAKNVIT
jgi:glycerate dehydrogenase